MNKAYMQYTEQYGITATPGELLIMLFNAGIKNIRIAMIQIQAGKMEEAHNRLMKAQDIINELMLSLDESYEIAKDLMALYTFIKEELIAANLKKDTEKLGKLIPLLTDLRNTWEEANKLARVR